jgi:hypothetical protein
MASSSSSAQIPQIVQFSYENYTMSGGKRIANFAHLKETLSRNRLEQRRTLCNKSNDYTVNGKPNHNI